MPRLATRAIAATLLSAMSAAAVSQGIEIPSIGWSTTIAGRADGPRWSVEIRDVQGTGSEGPATITSGERIATYELTIGQTHHQGRMVPIAGDRATAPLSASSDPSTRADAVYLNEGSMIGVKSHRGAVVLEAEETVVDQTRSRPTVVDARFETPIDRIAGPMVVGGYVRPSASESAAVRRIFVVTRLTQSDR